LKDPARAPTNEPFLPVAVALAGALLLMGCGANSQRLAAAVTSPQSSAASTFNDADVTFAQQMIPHHQQAIQMAHLAASHAQNPKVKALAAKIAAQQASEIRTMTGWLQAWGKSVPTAMPRTMSPMPGMMGSPAPGPSGTPMPGMLSEGEMSQLMSAHGADFDRMFLQMMILHHQGALDMAKAERVDGVNPAARKLASQIEGAQTAQIAQMEQMIGQ
jgi:uncharacterized protein (DUF305 family)